MKKTCLTRCKSAVSISIALFAGLLAASPQIGRSQIIRRCQPCVPCPTSPSTTAAPPATTGPAGTAEAAPNPPSGGTAQSNTTPPNTTQANPAQSSPDQSSPAADQFAQQDAGAASGPASAAPNMIGDAFGGGGRFTIFVNNGESTTSVTATLPGAAIPRFKMAEDTSPIPTDRIFSDFDIYHNVPINNPNLDVTAYTPGFEKTFVDGMLSFEMRLPLASTLDSNIYLDGTTCTGVGEVGDLSMVFKCLLTQSDTLALSAGLAMTVPTARDSQYFVNHYFSQPSAKIANRSVHLMPFIGWLWTPNDRLFAIGYVQADVDVNGDPVSLPDFYNPNNFTSIGNYRDPTLLYVDLSVGYWLRHIDDAKTLVTGLAPVVELHLNQTVGPAYTPDPYTISPVFDSFSVVDLTIGGHLELHKNLMVTAAFATPLTSDREFDGQFRSFVNYRF